MLSFKKALEAHCDDIELNVQLSKDGELVIIHGEKSDRTTNGTGHVMNYTLREYFDLAKDFSIYTQVEIKNSIIEYPGIEVKLIALIWEIHRNGIKIHAWTVNEEKNMRTLIRKGIYGIITNNPARLHRVLEVYKQFENLTLI